MSSAVPNNTGYQKKFEQNLDIEISSACSIKKDFIALISSEKNKAHTETFIDNDQDQFPLLAGPEIQRSPILTLRDSFNELNDDLIRFITNLVELDTENAFKLNNGVKNRIGLKVTKLVTTIFDIVAIPEANVALRPETILLLRKLVDFCGGEPESFNPDFYNKLQSSFASLVQCGKISSAAAMIVLFPRDTSLLVCNSGHCLHDSLEDWSKENQELIIRSAAFFIDSLPGQVLELQEHESNNTYPSNLPGFLKAQCYALKVYTQFFFSNESKANLPDNYLKSLSNLFGSLIYLREEGLILAQDLLAPFDKNIQKQIVADFQHALTNKLRDETEILIRLKTDNLNGFLNLESALEFGKRRKALGIINSLLPSPLELDNSSLPTLKQSEEIIRAQALEHCQYWQEDHRLFTTLAPNDLERGLAFLGESKLALNGGQFTQYDQLVHLLKILTSERTVLDTYATNEAIELAKTAQKIETNGDSKINKGAQIISNGTGSAALKESIRMHNPKDLRNALKEAIKLNKNTNPELVVGLRELLLAAKELSPKCSKKEFYKALGPVMEKEPLHSWLQSL
jgi:hypothetical protein